jgi:hypothetical protein
MDILLWDTCIDALGVYLKLFYISFSDKIENYVTYQNGTAVVPLGSVFIQLMSHCYRMAATLCVAVILIVRNLGAD